MCMQIFTTSGAFKKNVDPCFCLVSFSFYIMSVVFLLGQVCWWWIFSSFMSKVSLLPSFLKDIFTEYRILGLQHFTFSHYFKDVTLSSGLLCFWQFVCCIGLMFLPIYQYFFPLPVWKFFYKKSSFFFFFNSEFCSNSTMVTLVWFSAWGLLDLGGFV